MGAILPPFITMHLAGFSSLSWKFVMDLLGAFHLAASRRSHPNLAAAAFVLLRTIGTAIKNGLLDTEVGIDLFWNSG